MKLPTRSRPKPPFNGLAAIVAAALIPAPASAQPATPAPAPAAPAGPVVPADQARGWQEEPGTESEDVILFLPRAILTIPRLVVKAVFWPLQHGLRFVDRHAVIPRVKEVFYNDAETAAILPALSFQTFLGLSAGVSAFHDDLAGHGESLSFDARFGGRYTQAYQLRFGADHFGGTNFWIESMARFEIEPRLLFQGYGDRREQSTGAGLGPRDGAVETRFRQTRMLSLFRAGYTAGSPGVTAKFGATGILNHRTFGPSPDEAEPSIEQVYDTSRIAGFDAGSNTVEINGNVIIDTRDVAGATSSGIYLEMFGGGVAPSSLYRYGHYGTELTTYWNLYKKTRVLVVRAAHEGVIGKESEIPFADLPRLGGPSRLRGYALDQFRDKLTAVATLEYHYPIHEILAGSLFIDAGHAAREYKDLVALKDWRVGGGGGFIIRSKKEIIFTIDVAYGDGVAVYFTTDPLRAFDRRSQQL